MKKNVLITSPSVSDNLNFLKLAPGYKKAKKAADILNKKSENRSILGMQKPEKMTNPVSKNRSILGIEKPKPKPLSKKVNLGVKPDVAKLIETDPKKAIQKAITEKNISPDSKLPEKPGEPLYDKKFEILKPFKKTMQNSLSLSGVTSYPDRIDLLAQTFYNEIVAKDQTNSFDGSNLPQIYFCDFYNDNVDEAQQAVIDAIISYFRKVKEKEINGEDLTPVQMGIGKAIKTDKNYNILPASTPLQFDQKTLMIAIAGFLGLIVIITLVKK